MVQGVRYAKTPAGVEEISARRNHLRGKLRTMLILVDPGKTTDELRAQALGIGAPTDCLDTLLAGGFIAPLTAAAPATSNVEASGGAAVSSDELTRFRDAKTFMNETIVQALGLRAFLFTLKLERCATRAELGQLLPDYERALRKGTPGDEAAAMVDRAKEMLELEVLPG